MLSVKFYLDKASKTSLYPIYLVLRQKEVQVKVATGVKINKADWDNAAQKVLDTDINHTSNNKFLLFLRQEVEKYLASSLPAHLTNKRIKDHILSLVKSRKEITDVRMVCEDQHQYSDREKITFLDLFAGAGGFSEGFLQAELGKKVYDFLLASDINENCELTHLARYNHQLGLGTEFLKRDISEPDFLVNLLLKLKGQTVDVVCGGPPCQSFSLAGKRKKFDKKDDLFSHYLKVIRQLRPKYFVMENVKGILTKENGRICEMILQEMRSIVDLQEYQQLLHFVGQLRSEQPNHADILEFYILRLQFECLVDTELDQIKEKYIQIVESKFRVLTPKIVDYKTSKTDSNISTIRHGFNLLKRAHDLAYIRKKVINEKAFCDLDNDSFVEDFNNFLDSIELDSIIDRVNNAFENLRPSKVYKQEIDEIIKALEIYVSTFNECIDGLFNFVQKAKKETEFSRILALIQLYNIEKPFVALASDYGVPQNRERVLFIGCRKDQKLITNIPATVAEKEKVTVFEALHDLDFLDNGDERFNYENDGQNYIPNTSERAMGSLVKKRVIDGKIVGGKGFTYAEWSRKGRLSSLFPNIKSPFYVRNTEELDNSLFHLAAPLHNHKTSNQNEDVVKRLDVILNAGNYDDAKADLKAVGLDSEKRNYNVLKPDSQSPTIMTIPDDYIHYARPRALTVREMARLQSFDDSFVFQGKRSTGGNKRKTEVPQFTLVGNAVPPLLARAVAIEILKHIV